MIRRVHGLKLGPGQKHICVPGSDTSISSSGLLEDASIASAWHDCACPGVKGMISASGMQDDEIVQELSSILEELKEKMPLLEEVANPALKPRHWIDIHSTLGTLQEFCPVEIERRERIESAKAIGEQADVSDLVCLTCLLFLLPFYSSHSFMAACLAEFRTRVKVDFTFHFSCDASTACLLRLESTPLQRDSFFNFTGLVNARQIQSDAS